MKYFLLLCAVSVVCTATGQAPSFEPSYHLLCAGSAIDVGYYASPCIVDWDQDTVQDLILGQFTGGYIRFCIIRSKLATHFGVMWPLIPEQTGQ